MDRGGQVGLEVLLAHQTFRHMVRDTVLNVVLVQVLGEQGILLLHQLVGQQFGPGQLQVVLVDQLAVGEHEVLDAVVAIFIVVAFVEHRVDVVDHILAVFVVVVVGPLVVGLDALLVFPVDALGEGLDEHVVQVFLGMHHIGVIGINDVLDSHLVKYILGLEHNILLENGEPLHHQGETVQHTV